MIGAMLSQLMSVPGLAGMVTGLAYLGCITALAVGGHITGGEALTALGILGGGATAVTATHVTGNAISNASVPTPPPAQPEKLV